MSRVCSWWVVSCVAALALVSVGCSTSSSPPILVSVSPSSPQGIDQSQSVAITATVINDAPGKGVAWTLSGPGSLSSSRGASITYNSPTTSITNAQQATVTAMSIADQTKSASVHITVNPYPQMPLQNLADGSVGAPYSQTIALTGGTAPFQWEVYNGAIITGWRVGGAVPDGLKLDPKTGVISGTPTGAGTWYFEAMVTDAAEIVSYNALSIQIKSTAPPGNPVPFLNQPLMPTAVSPGSSQFTLSVSGAGFVSGATVNFNRLPLATTFVDNEHLTAAVPAGDVANAGTTAVTVVNPGPGGGASNVVDFQVAAPEAVVSFRQAPNSPLQLYLPYGIRAGDFNEDGKPDLAVAAAVTTSIFLGNGDGTFTPAASSPMPVPSPPYDNFPSPYVGPLAVGDFNNSGHPGLAIGEVNNLAAVIMLGNGDGTFVTSSAAFAYALGDPMTGVEAADFNGDGNLDLAITNELTGESPVVLGYGHGAFSRAGALYTSGFPMGLAVGDFNGDGKLDAAVVSGGTPNNPGSGVDLDLGKGGGTFTLAQGSPIVLGQYLTAIIAADFNGDGNLDLAVADSFANTVTILLGNGDGTFAALTPIPVGTQPEGLVAGDFNADGKLDLATANYTDGTITLLLGKGDGTFTQASGSPFASRPGSYQITAADFNGDGKLDLAATNMSDGSVSILLQQ